MKTFVNIQQDLILNAFLNRKPMELTEELANLIEFLGIEYYFGTPVLQTL